MTARTVDRDSLAEIIHDATPVDTDGGMSDVCNRYEEHLVLADAILAALPPAEEHERLREAVIDAAKAWRNDPASIPSYQYATDCEEALIAAVDALVTESVR